MMRGLLIYLLLSPAVVVAQCSIDSLVYTIDSCEHPAGTFNMSGWVYFQNPPSTGTLTVHVDNGGPGVDSILNAPFISPAFFSITDANCPASPITITASFSDSTTCNFSAMDTVPDSCALYIMGPIVIELPSAPIQYTSNVSGGQWLAAPCGGAIDINTGIFDVCSCGPGSHTITYMANVPGCGALIQVLSVYVDFAPTIDTLIAQGNPYCPLQDSITFSAYSPGGNWSASCGNCIDSLGVFNLDSAGTGTHTVSYVVNEPCGGVNVDQVAIQVDSVYDGTIITTLDTICTYNSPVQLAAVDTGGTWSGSCGACISINGLFDPNLAGSGMHTVNYDFINTCSISGQMTIVVDPCLGIPESHSIEVNIFPNPTTSSLNIQSSARLRELVLYDLSGRVLWQSSNAPCCPTLDLSGYSKGMYLLRLRAPKGIKTVVVEKQ